MGKKRKATITVNPVTWDGKTNKVLKYQVLHNLMMHACSLILCIRKPKQ